MTNRRAALVLALGVLSPLVVAAIALATKPWVPVLDMAMTELRVRDVGGRHTPLVGLPGRIGQTIQEQGSHPGPWSFYLVAPFYRLAGARAWGMELASCVINAAVVAATVAIGARRFGPRGALAFAAIAAVAVRGYGPNVLTHPWNPYFPVLLWLLGLLAAWLVLDGWHWLAVLVVALTSVAAQTHLPYLPNAIVLDALVLAVVAWRVRRDRAPSRPLLVAAGVGAALWLPPFVEQVVRSPGNIGKLVRHFTTEQPEPAIGIGPAAKLVLQHLDWFSLTIDLVGRKDAFVHRAGVAGDPVHGVNVGGLLVLALWVSAAAWAWKHRHRLLLALHAVITATLVSAFVSSTRIFGKVWFYLTLWLSGTALLMLLAILATAWLVLRERDLPARWPHVRVAALAVIGAATVASVVAAIGQAPPEQGQGQAVHDVLPDLRAALPRDARYVVFWQESVVPGSQGYAVLNELERHGYDVGVHETWRVPATSHRVFPLGAYDSEVHVVSGGWIERWPAQHPEATRLLIHDPRDDTARARFDELDQRVAARLTELGRSDLLETVDTNLFGASLDPDLPRDVVDALSEMLLIGEPLAIFLAPPGSTH